MKFIFVILLYFPFILKSQVWVKPNAVWYYKYTDRTTALLFGYLKVEHVKDSTINGISCKALVTTKFDFAEYQMGEVHLIGESIIDTNYTYANSDTVFYWKNNKFQILYDFSKQINETWFVDDSIVPICASNSKIKVSNSYFHNLNGTDYRALTLEPILNSFNKLNGNYNERFGNHDNLSKQHNFLFPTEWTCEAGISDESNMIKFICFKDDELTYSPDGGGCGNILSLLENRKNKQFQICPKPTVSGQISVKTTRSEEYVLEVINLLGESVYSKKHFFLANTSSLIQLSIPSGMYVVNIISKEGKVIHSEKLSVLN